MGSKKLYLILVGLLVVSTMSILVSAGNFEYNLNEIIENAKDFFIEVAKGNIPGQDSDNKFGENLDVGTLEEDIQSQGGTLEFLTTAEKISIISSDTTNDIDGGDNANKVIIFGLDSNWNKISEEVTLEATEVNTTKEYLRVYRMYVSEVGTYGATNLGTISGMASISGTKQIEIPAESGQSQTTHYSVPAGYSLIITGVHITVDTGKTIDFFGKFRTNANETSNNMGAVRIIKTYKGLDSPLEVNFIGLKIPEKSDIWTTAISSVGSAKVSVDYDFLEYED